MHLEYLFFPLVQTEHGIILSSILMVPIAIATEISSCGHGPLGEAGKLLVINYNTDTDGGCRNPSPHYWHCNSPFTLAPNGYEPVHGIVLKNGSPPFTLATIIGVSITHAASSPAEGCCCGYFTVFISA